MDLFHDDRNAGDRIISDGNLYSAQLGPACRNEVVFKIKAVRNSPSSNTSQSACTYFPVNVTISRNLLSIMQKHKRVSMNFLLLLFVSS